MWRRSKAKCFRMESLAPTRHLVENASVTSPYMAPRARWLQPGLGPSGECKR